MTTSPPVDPAGAVHGQRQAAGRRRRRSRTPSARSASSSGRQRPVPGVRVAVEGDRARRPARRPAAGTACTVPASPTSTWAGPRSGPRLDHPAVVVGRGDVRRPCARRPAAISSVSRARSGRAQRATGRRPARASTSARAVIDLEPGRRTVARDRAGGGRRGPRRRVAVTAAMSCRPVDGSAAACPLRRRRGRRRVGVAWRACAAGTRRRGATADLSALFDARRRHRRALAPDYNVAPTDPVPVVRVVAARTAAGCCASARWGLVPPWAERPAGRRPHDQRAGRDGGHLPGVRAVVRRRRCLVPADGWYEWVRATGGGKQPYFMTPARRLGARVRRAVGGLGRETAAHLQRADHGRRSASWPRCTTGCR